MGWDDTARCGHTSSSLHASTTTRHALMREPATWLERTSAVVNGFMDTVHDGAHATGEEVALPLHVHDSKLVRYPRNDVGDGEMEPGNVTHTRTHNHARHRSFAENPSQHTTNTLPPDNTHHAEGRVRTPATVTPGVRHANE
jgi:hypothetical protein